MAFGTAGSLANMGYMNSTVGNNVDYMIRSMDYDGIPREHSERIISLVQGRYPPIGYTVVIPDRGGIEYQYVFNPNQSANTSGWILRHTYTRELLGTMAQTAVTNTGTSQQKLASSPVKESNKNPKTVRHQFLRNRLKNRLIKE